MLHKYQHSAQKPGHERKVRRGLLSPRAPRLTSARSTTSCHPECSRGVWLRRGDAPCAQADVSTPLDMTRERAMSAGAGSTRLRPILVDSCRSHKVSSLSGAVHRPSRARFSCTGPGRPMPDRSGQSPRTTQTYAAPPPVAASCHPERSRGVWLRGGGAPCSQADVSTPLDMTRGRAMSAGAGSARLRPVPVDSCR